MLPSCVVAPARGQVRRDVHVLPLYMTETNVDMMTSVDTMTTTTTTTTTGLSASDLEELDSNDIDDIEDIQVGLNQDDEETIMMMTSQTKMSMGMLPSTIMNVSDGSPGELDPSNYVQSEEPLRHISPPLTFQKYLTMQVRSLGVFVFERSVVGHSRVECICVLFECGVLPYIHDDDGEGYIIMPLVCCKMMIAIAFLSTTQHSLSNIFFCATHHNTYN
jgi:hypothetical protein